jgi:CRP-like cAMP-binding protein
MSVAEKPEEHDLFALLNTAETSSPDGSGVVRIEKGDRLYSEGVAATHVFVLLRGKVELRKSTNAGAGVAVEELEEGDIFGASSFSEGDRYVVNAECVADGEVLRVERGLLRRLLDENLPGGYAMPKSVSAVFYRRCWRITGGLLVHLKVLWNRVPARR